METTGRCPAVSHSLDPRRQVYTLNNGLSDGRFPCCKLWIEQAILWWFTCNRGIHRRHLGVKVKSMALSMSRCGVRRDPNYHVLWHQMLKISRRHQHALAGATSCNCKPTDLGLVPLARSREHALTVAATCGTRCPSDAARADSRLASPHVSMPLGFFVRIVEGDCRIGWVQERHLLASFTESTSRKAI